MKGFKESNFRILDDGLKKKKKINPFSRMSIEYSVHREVLFLIDFQGYWKKKVRA